MFSPKVQKSLLTGEWTEESFAEWDADDDPIVAEVRRTRQAILAKYGHNIARINAALTVIEYACGDTRVSPDLRDPPSPSEADLPKDLTGLIPDREDFIGNVRMRRTVAATRQLDLDAYNEDARRRALVLGFPAETFVVTAEEVKVVAEELRSPLPYYTCAPRDD
jgi:hypothetical protein